MRGTEKTLAMVNAIPDDGAVVGVHSPALRVYVEEMVRDLCGVDIAKRTKVIVVESGYDLPKLYGRRDHILIDHAVNDHAHPAVAAELNVLARGIAVARP